MYFFKSGTGAMKNRKIMIAGMLICAITAGCGRLYRTQTGWERRSERRRKLS